MDGVLKGKFDWKQPEFKTPAEVLAYYEEAVPPLLKQVAEASGETLAQNISVRNVEPPGGDLPEPAPAAHDPPPRPALGILAADGREGPVDLRTERRRSGKTAAEA